MELQVVCACATETRNGYRRSGNICSGDELEGWAVLGGGVGISSPDRHILMEVLLFLFKCRRNQFEDLMISMNHIVHQGVMCSWGLKEIVCSSRADMEVSFEFCDLSYF